MATRAQRRASARKPNALGASYDEANILSENGKPTGNRPSSDPRETKSAQERHEQRKAWFLAEAFKQAGNRALMAKCEAYYDSEQWDREDAEAVRERGQNPVVYNEIKPTIDWLIGTERRSRVDFFVVAEDDDEGADDDATLKTKLLKYLDDVNRAAFERSYAAEDCFKAGVGWLEVGLRGDKTGVPVFVGAESWRNILWDSNSRKRDLSDARYVFRVKVVDLDIALAIFPDKKDELECVVQVCDSVNDFTSWLSGAGLINGLDAFGDQGVDRLDLVSGRPSDLFNPRKRVLLIECWCREPVRRPASEAALGDPVEMRMRVAIMTEHDTLLETWSPFKHDAFPFIPMWAYIKRRTGLPYSPILPLLGPQEALNHRMSKSLHEASMNQLKIEEGAVNAEVMDIDEIRDELNAPDGIPVFAHGALAGGKVQERPASAAAAQQLALAERDILAIRSMSGVTGENRGMDGNAVSGKAVLAKQDQGSLLTAELFDNLLLARQIEGDITLSLAEQFVRAPMTIRVAGEGQRFERTRINVPQADGTYLNDITARRAHFVVGEQAWKQSYAEAAFESLMQVLTQLASAAPNVVVALLDVVFDMHPNLPRKQAVLARIRSVNGQSDPDGKLTPEQAQQRAQQQQQAAAQFALQMAQLKADVSKAEAQGQKLNADAMAKRLETLYMSAQAAQVLAQIPQATPIADQLLKSAGFQDADGGALAEQPPQAAAPAEMAPEPAAEAAQPTPELLQADGAMQGIETPAPDGVFSGA